MKFVPAAEEERTMKDEERIEFKELVGRYWQGRNKKAKIIAAELRKGKVWIVPGWEPEWNRGEDTPSDWYWTSLVHGELLSIDWSPPEPEPEVKEVDPVALELRRWAIDEKVTDLGCESNVKTYTDRAAKIRKLVGAEVSKLRMQTVDTSSVDLLHEKLLEKAYSAKADADEVQELAKAIYKNQYPDYKYQSGGWAEKAAKVALSWSRSKRPSLRVCAVSDVEFATELCRAANKNPMIKYGDGGELWLRAARAAKGLLGAVDVDFVVQAERRHPASVDIKPLTPKAKDVLRRFQEDDGWIVFRGTEGSVETIKDLYHAGCVGLLDENWKDGS